MKKKNNCVSLENFPILLKKMAMMKRPKRPGELVCFARKALIFRCRGDQSMRFGFSNQSNFMTVETGNKRPPPFFLARPKRGKRLQTTNDDDDVGVVMVGFHFEVRLI